MWGALVWAYLMSASLLLHWSVEICGEVDKTSCPNLTYLPDLWLGTRYWGSAILPIKDWLVALLRSEPVLFRVLILLGVAASLRNQKRKMAIHKWDRIYHLNREFISIIR